MDSQNGTGMETEAGGHVRKHMDNASSIDAVIEPGVPRNRYRHRTGNPKGPSIGYMTGKRWPSSRLN